MWASGWLNSSNSSDFNFTSTIDGANSFFARPCPGCNGNFPRNGLLGPGQINFDFSLFKTTAITEQLKVQFRFEVFNAFNHTSFLLPNSATGGSRGNRINIESQFGQSDTTLDPRQIQLALKFIW